MKTSAFNYLDDFNLVQTLLLKILPKSYHISYFCDGCLQEPKRTALLINLLSFNHSVSGVLVDINNIRQRDFVKVKAKIVKF